MFVRLSRRKSHASRRRGSEAAHVFFADFAARLFRSLAWTALSALSCLALIGALPAVNTQSQYTTLKPGFRSLQDWGGSLSSNLLPASVKNMNSNCSPSD